MVCVPLKLVTGPANSAKAAVVLDGVRAALDRDPLLVVPTAADAERYRRELAENGAVFGPRVLRFAGLIDEAARRAGSRPPAAGRDRAGARGRRGGGAGAARGAGRVGGDARLRGRGRAAVRRA